IRSDAETTASVRVATPATQQGTRLTGETSTYELVAVPVEANTNGGSKTAVGVRPPDAWMEHFVREAPFEVAEVLVPTERIELSAGVTHAALVDVSVGRDARPGLYAGEIIVSGGAGPAHVPLQIRIHDVAMPEHHALHSHIWLFPEPHNLTGGEPPQWWSEAHWRLLDSTARELARFGQDTILTPLIDYEEPLIQVIREADGSFSFDYTRFDRWVRLFRRHGFRLFAGHHIATLPEPWVYGPVHVLDRETGERQVLFERGRGTQAWLTFIPTFYEDLHRHLSERGWLSLYIQHQLDEPRDGEVYRALAALAREHLPGVRTIDAINSRPEVFSPLVDMQVFALTILADNRELAAQRREQGQSVWLYHCCSPPPPYPNRHLDERLSNSRLYPWLAHLLEADGYLYWGANVYRGADPYETSIGPVPGGSQDPGHPPGDNWLFYPGPDGLRGSLRQVAFRDGMIDHTLLTMLAGREPGRAGRIMRGVARSIRHYATQPQAYHRARRHLLVALEAGDR
ncbi:MAG: DUF4091 domain-containing protein, partial [Armatimonadota bacterium]